MPEIINTGSTNDTAFTTLRKFLSPALVGSNWTALLEALATGDQYNWDLAAAMFDQLFAASASGAYLDQRGADLGVRRPYNVGMDDALYRKLLAHSATDQITFNSIQESLEIFYGEDSTRAWVVSTQSEPFVLENGDDLVVLINGTDEIRVVFVDNDFRDIAAATAEEVAAVVTRVFRQFYSTAYAVARLDPETNLTSVAVYTNALGLRGLISVQGGKAQNTLVFPTLIATEQANGTIFQVSVGSITGRVQYSWTGVGPNPRLYKVHVGDYVNVYGANFAAVNRGSFKILAVNNTTFEFESDFFTTETVTIAGASEILFYRPTNHTIYNSNHPTYASQPAPSLVRTVLPVTSQIVDRTRGKAAYLQSQVPVDVIAFHRTVEGIVTIETDTNHGLSLGDRVLIDNLYAGVPPAQTKSFAAGALFAARHSMGLSLIDGGKRALATGGKHNGVYLDGCEVYEFVDDDYVEIADWDDAAGIPAMALTRAYHIQLTLPSGYVMVIGGRKNAGVVLDTCEIYIPDQNVWTSTGTMTTERLGHQVVLLQDGRVWVSGGDLAEADANIETYDSATGVWTQGAAMSSPRRDHVAVLLQDGRVFVGGGQNGGVALDTCEIYNPWLDEFTPVGVIPDMPIIRSGAKACFVPNVGVSGKVFVCGGTDNPAVPNAKDNAWFYDPVRNEWEVLTPMGSDRLNHTVAYLHDKTVLVVGGTSTAPTVERFEPLDKVWGGFYAGVDINDTFDKHAMVETTVLSYATAAQAQHNMVGDLVRVPDRDVLIAGLAAFNDTGETGCWDWGTHGIVCAGGVNGEAVVTEVVSPTVFRVQSPEWRPTAATAYGSWPAAKITVSEGTITQIAAPDSDTPIGPYIYDPVSGLAVTGSEGTINATLYKNNSYGSIDCTGVGDIPDGVGWLVFGFGTKDQVGPVGYVARPNSNTLVLDRSFVFDKTVPANSTVTWLKNKSPWMPVNPELYGSTYMTASPAGRVAASANIDEIVAAGVPLDKAIVYPGDRGLGGEGLPVEGESKLSDVVTIWSGDEIDETVAKARESELV